MAAQKLTPERLESLWTIDDLAEFTKISIRTLKLYTITGRLPSIKIGRHRRYIPDEIRKWLKRQMV